MEAANTAAHALVSSHLDAGNSILHAIAQGQLQHIQGIHYSPKNCYKDLNLNFEPKTKSRPLRVIYHKIS